MDNKLQEQQKKGREKYSLNVLTKLQDIEHVKD